MKYRFNKWAIISETKTPEIDEIVRLATDLEAAESRHELELLKPPSDMRRVVAGKLSDGKEIVVKYYMPYGVKRGLKDLLRAGYSLSAYRIGNKMLERGIETPKPLVCGRKKSGWRLTRSFCVTERITGFTDVGAKARNMLASGTRDAQEDFVGKMASKLFETHRKGFYHPDIKDFHLFVRDKGDDFDLIFIDLDRCYLLPFVPAAFRRRNLYQVRYYILREYPDELKALFLKRYCELWKNDPNDRELEFRDAVRFDINRIYTKELTLVKQEMRALYLQGELLKRFPMPEDVERRIEARRARKIERRRELAEWKSLEKKQAPKK